MTLQFRKIALDREDVVDDGAPTIIVWVAVVL